ncbi:plasmid mobilization protein [Chitinophaga sp. 22321]|uniref:Mobilization protein n=1 Tax=Chitinophaga hostae TaxID=2831022 RepID=A0ABS5J7T5_9BACT|nr:mobilization protein [Chitinophaga hostae]MBS0031245.1 mobilization protein [Chitinophaga hostae]
MTQENKQTKKKVGRPSKGIKKDQFLAIKCNQWERSIIEAKASASNLTISEYLRKMGVAGKIDRREKVFPKEVLELTGTLNHLAANLNQIARIRNGIEQLSLKELSELKVQSGDLKALAEQIKAYFL